MLAHVLDARKHLQIVQVLGHLKRAQPPGLVHWTRVIDNNHRHNVIDVVAMWTEGDRGPARETELTVSEV